MNQAPAPKPALSLIDAISIIVGIVIGAGIFKTPSFVAGTTDSQNIFFLVWILGGLVSLIGALCYAELCTAFPNPGGDYHFITRAFGSKLSFLHAWSRLSIIQTGSIALLAFIFGDYISRIYSLGEFSSVWYAAMIVMILTAINIAGIRSGTMTQKILTLLEVVGVIVIIVTGLFFTGPAVQATTPAVPATSSNSIGLAMVFVLLTFGGWNEAAYISAELKKGSGHMVRSLVFSLFIITFLYLLINYSYLRALGQPGMARSEAVAADLMQVAWGPAGVWLIGVLVAIAALTSTNATIFTGARTNYALGKDFRIFSFLGQWDERTSAPTNAFLLQGVVSILLISLGLFTRRGFETMVEYTAPVFWTFFFLVGLSVFVLRIKEPHVSRPFKVPFYPLTPIIFCLSTLYLLYSSLMYTGFGALVGAGVLLLGGLILWIAPQAKKSTLIPGQIAS